MSSFKNWFLSSSESLEARTNYRIQVECEIDELLNPETETERQLLQKEDFRAGLMWGTPRYGHPEGKIVLHIREIFDNIDHLHISPSSRERLRLIALSHDTFKYREDNSFPRDWSKHHAVHARRFMEDHSTDEAMLDIIELHDEAFYSWRTIYIYHQRRKGMERLKRLQDRLGDNLELFHLFFKCDTCTGDKNPAPLFWFEETVFQ